MYTDEYQEADTGLGWYFSKQPRSIITIPILLIIGVNVIYHFVMLILIQIDLLIGNFIVWLFLGEVIAGGIAGLALTAAYVPLILLPQLWHSRRIWGIVKIVIFVLLGVACALIAGLISIGALKLVDIFAELRTTLWWAELWGVAS